MNTHSFRLIVSCPDRVGLVAAVSSFLASEGGLLTEANYYRDPDSNWFFMRQVIAADSLPYGAEELTARFAPLAEQYDMQWRLTDTSKPKRVVLMASTQAHCLSDLLYRWRSGEMQFDIPCVISNHDELRSYVNWHNIPYHHIPVDQSDKTAHFADVATQIAQSRADVIVLARYMQILPPALCATYPGQIINIHHSFLPAFVGAKPYHQAAERGVKLIGATCHYVTSDLDAGPIIEQDVVRISHHDSVPDLVRKGKDVEKNVLAKGLRYHLEDRVLLHGNKTIVFE
ncbi:MAG: formyltetrahydrofolate deformylase [Porticoccus sp.]|uniref:formyltetrahydrofolate deformylase n=1 Tax=Porticoccus sp. TaxID=2024853 RepID=UPI000C0FA929|nr:formyltetrahydrofolate deformylase [Porticoccus sp.]MAZ71082.1 formyltetrahydrofolate deformylase [Porticoccus sp.]PHS75159.1 MAG: formyltetrahydrofolate deformylase [Porticoccus sp.]|tara:strand:- start:2155 stop:3012 length:858 start_codon:yes stop_codon:yes gene_type:complete